MQFIEDYRTQYLSLLGNIMQFSKNSAWSIACSAHCYADFKIRYAVDVVRVPAVEGLTVKDAVESFVFEDKRISSVDKVTWPNNEPCAYWSPWIIDKCSNTMGKNKSGEIFSHILRKLLIELIIPTDIAVCQPLSYPNTLETAILGNPW